MVAAFSIELILSPRQTRDCRITLGLHVDDEVSMLILRPIPHPITHIIGIGDLLQAPAPACTHDRHGARILWRRAINVIRLEDMIMPVEDRIYLVLVHQWFQLLLERGVWAMRGCGIDGEVECEELPHVCIPSKILIKPI